MRPVLLIAWYDMRRVLRERESLFWLFIGPLIFAIFFGVLLRPSAPQAPQLVVVNEDDSDRVASGLSDLLAVDGVRIRHAAQVEAGRRCLVIPRGASVALAAGSEVRFVLTSGAEETNAERNLAFKIVKAATRLSFALRAGGGQGGARGGGRAEGPLVLVAGDLGVSQRPMTTGFQRSVPAYLVMFVFLNLLVSGGGIAEDRASGRLRRMAMTPIARWQIVLGKLLGRFGIGWIQIVYMVVFGLAAGITWAASLWLFLVFLSVFALAAAALGILLGTLFDDPDRCATVAVWTTILLSPLGGLWWPLEVVGPAMRQVAYAVPTGWAMEGVNAMIAFGAGPAEIAPFAAAFAGLFAVAFPLAARRLKV